MHKLFIPITIILASLGIAACVATPSSDADSCHSSLPAGFTIVEQGTDGSFIRISASHRASSAAIDEIAAALDGKFDRIDLCFDTANDRGDEYLAIIDGKVYDYENNRIYPLNTSSR